jgi:hypothetical protein
VAGNACEFIPLLSVLVKIEHTIFASDQQHKRFPMFAFVPIVTALLALSSSVLPAHANGMESFDYTLSITFDDPDAGKITGADKKIIEDAVVTSFNNVHDTSVINLESFKLSSFKPGSVLSKILPGYLGGSYSYGGGKGNNCRMCGSGTYGTGKRYAYLTRTLYTNPPSLIVVQMTFLPTRLPLPSLTTSGKLN